MNQELNQIYNVLSDHAKRITKDSGLRDVNEETGFNRDVQEGKYQFSEHAEELLALILPELEVDDSEYLNTDYDLEGTVHPNLIHDLLINRTEAVLKRGADKYGTDNWERGTYLSRSFNSLFRHIIQWYAGDTSEDHLAAAVCNIMFLMVHERQLQHRQGFGQDHPEFADAGALYFDPVRYAMPTNLDKD